MVLGSYSTTKPHQHTLALQKLKYDVLSEGHEQECFHATEDRQAVRDEVYKIIKQSNDAVYDFVYIEKNKTHPSKQNKKDVYAILAGALTSYIFGRLDQQGYNFNQIIVVIDKALTKKEQDYFKTLIKPRLKRTNRPFRLYFFQTKSDPNGQIADYGAWARSVSLARNEHRPLREIRNLISNDFNVFRRGTRRYY